MRLALCTLLVAATSLAQSAGPKLDAFREKVLAERAKLGLDKKKEKFPTPEVVFSGKPADDGVNAIVCPGEATVVSLEGVPPRSLVLSRSDDIELSKESWAGNRWTGTLTAKKTAGPHTFELDTVFANSGQRSGARGFLLGCRFSLTFNVDGATMVTKVDLRGQNQSVTGEWKKGGKVLGQRAYALTMTEERLSLTAALDEADQQRLMTAMQAMMGSSKMKALDVRFAAAMKKMETCGKLPPEKMGACFAPLQAENEKIAAERSALQTEAEIAAAPPFGCNELNAPLARDGDATNCAGHRNADRLRMSWSWTSP